jgi:hypothetical protein
MSWLTVNWQEVGKPQAVMALSADAAPICQCAP